mgnify:CR=1 FL=1
MTILAIDTALGETSLTLSSDAEILAHLHHPERDQQARMLLPWIESLLKKQNIWYPELTGIAVCIGPGGFTGIRIGLATARALALAGNIPIAGFSTLEILAHYVACTRQETDVTALLPAGRGMVFHQTFNIVDQHPVARSEPSMLSPEEVTPFGITASTEPALQPDVAVPIHTQATTLSHLAAGFPARFSEVSPAPLYIRPPDAKPQSSLL